MRAAVVSTWNVHECLGRDGERDPGRVAEVLKEIAADVFALQEIHSDEHRGGALDQAGFLAEALDLEPVFGPTLERRGGRYGNLLLTRLPLLGVRRHDLSVRGREPRGALEVDFESPLGRLRVVATHLGLRASERAAQARVLLDGLRPPEPGETLVVLGDWNEWLPWRAALRLPRRRYGVFPTPRTFPAWRPAFALDRVWLAPRAHLEAIRAHRSPLAIQASDHLPLVASLRAGGFGRRQTA
ncbi:MAG: endonuclease/exonuclease/phosphatase family protein [Acidobacteria bacterium]|nr:endonuclease/exonuclease/phosphatase family protein [Acidobacteriota bacterium]